MRNSSLNPLRLLAEAWAFLRSQPALTNVFLWLLLAPVLLMDLLNEYWPEGDTDAVRQIGNVGFLLATLLFVVVSYWGLASVLLVARRMVIHRAGRSRTSFKAVRRGSIRMILPLFFTSLLRTIVTIEWSLLAALPALLFVLGSQPCRATLSPLISAAGTILNGGTADPFNVFVAQFLQRCGPMFFALPLLIPAAIYQLRTVFFAVVVTSEDLRYRDALRRSRSIVRGRTWQVLWVLLALGVILFVPVTIAGGIAQFLQTAFLPDLPILSALLYDVLYAGAGFLFLLSLVAFYGKLRKEKGRVEEVVPE